MTSQVTDSASGAFVAVVRAREVLARPVTNLLKGHGLSDPQYNVLRILRGSGMDGLSCRRIGERMLTRVPDITRLLDRLEDAGYVARRRGEGADRRVVMTTITERGLNLLADLDGPVSELHRRQFAALDPADLDALAGLLQRVVEANEQMEDDSE